MADVLNGGPARPVTDQSTSELVQRASEQITTLVRDEIALAKATLRGSLPGTASPAPSAPPPPTPPPCWRRRSTPDTRA